MNAVTLVLVAFGASLSLLLGLWARQLRTRDATSVDVAWSFSLTGMAVFYALFSQGDPARRALVGILGALWSGRLGWYLFATRLRKSRGEDGRYAALRAEWGADAPVRFLRVYVAQAVAATLFSLPLLASMRGGPLDAWAVVGSLVWIVAVAGETIADRQLAAFRSKPENRGRVCREGLWAWSRHPNYFFEWIHWWAYVLIGHAAPLTFVGPVVMLALLLKGTGIPYNEAQALRSRGEAYREYMRTTSRFVPWPPSRPGA
jgi:steroid 5-alpha reductase family enzyme